MRSFATTREAKEFLVENIVAQAQHDGVSLSDVERKMLYFSETAWTLPDMAEVNEEFDRHYDQAEFERKITNVIRHIQHQQASNKDDDRGWMSAVNDLRNEDHYLLVMIRAAGSARPRGDFIKLVLTALAIVGAFLVLAIFMLNRC